MRQKAESLFLCYLLFTYCGVDAGKRRNSDDSDSGSWGAWPYVIGGGLLVAGLPVALGFTSTGIVAGSVASWMMSTSAVMNGGGVPAGGLVAMLQSVGATGGSTVLGNIGASLGYGVYKAVSSGDEEKEEEE
ncbi:interferon alpha-inducible protein 6 isoform X1 [Tenrec ecaudatus]|uniref:interferon alpha-inducible protein 6 isoform X1 n=1 Tax=Tenrec ecaudatus TaxID=94439 RepID=UPI003F5AC48A